MMKSTLTYLFAFFMCFQLMAQDKMLQVVYDVYPIKKAENTIDSKFADLLGRAYDTIEYHYQQVGRQAKFFSIPKINNSQTAVVDMSEIFIQTRGEFYYDYEHQVFENLVSSDNKTYIIELKSDDYNWVIEDELTPCFEFMCKKATMAKLDKGLKTPREYKTTVWYVEDYPIDVIPFGLLGLKGLIVKIDFNNNTMVSLNKIEENKKPVKISPFKKGIRVSQKDFDAMIEKQMDVMRSRRNNRIDKS